MDKEMRLFYNELQYPTSPKVAEVFEWFAKNPQELAFYYDGLELKKAIANKYSLDIDNVSIDNGSDAVLAIIFQTFLIGKLLAFPELSYGLYKTWGDYYGIKTKQVPLCEDFEINLKYYHGEQAILIANPNAQTGVVKSVAEIEKFVQNNKDTLIIIDEAYIDFTDEKSCASLVKKYENLLVVQTFSKAYGLANLRVGYVLGCEKLIERFTQTQQSTIEYSVNQVSQCAALAALNDKKYFDDIIAKIRKTRNWFTDEMRKLGFGVVDSQTNYVLVSSKDAVGVYAYLKEHNIIVSYLGMFSGEDYLRITIGTDEQMKKLLEVIGSYVVK